MPFGTLEKPQSEFYFLNSTRCYNERCPWDCFLFIYLFIFIPLSKTFLFVPTVCRCNILYVLMNSTFYFIFFIYKTSIQNFTFIKHVLKTLIQNLIFKKSTQKYTIHCSFQTVTDVSWWMNLVLKQRNLCTSIEYAVHRDQTPASQSIILWEIAQSLLGNLRPASLPHCTFKSWHGLRQSCEPTLWKSFPFNCRVYLLFSRVMPGFSPP